jgi:hypothetical protein
MLKNLLSKDAKRLVTTAALCATLAAMTGCAVAPSKPDAIVPATIASPTQHPQTVSVVTAGGLETNPAARLRLTNATLSEGLVAAINKHHVFSRVISGPGADYVLAVTLVNGDFPSFGVSFTVKAEMAWSLKKADGTTVWQQVIKSEGTATGGEAFAGTERVKMAMERAVRDNVAQGLAKIANLKL